MTRSEDEREECLVSFERGRIVRRPPFAYADLSGIRPSPSGRFVVAYVGGRGGIVVFRTNEEPPELIRIPVVASDLLWEDVP